MARELSYEEFRDQLGIEECKDRIKIDVFRWLVTNLEEKTGYKVQMQYFDWIEFVDEMRQAFNGLQCVHHKVLFLMITHEFLHKFPLASE